MLELIVVSLATILAGVASYHFTTARIEHMRSTSNHGWRALEEELENDG